VPERAAAAAIRQVGVPYRYGGASRTGFDCSGLVHFAYAQAGARTPRTTGDLWRQLAPVSLEDLRVGDILFFDIAGKVSHVGIYLGEDRFVHAPSSGKEVTVASLSSSFYEQAVIRGGRLDL
jgi:cell wall-associated NlpC family hydrolase